MSFTGDVSYIRHPVTDRACDFFESGSITIRTRDDNGVVLHAGWQDDYLMVYHEYLIIEIVQGSLRTAAYSLDSGKHCCIPMTL